MEGHHPNRRDRRHRRFFSEGRCSASPSIAADLPFVLTAPALPVQDRPSLVDREPATLLQIRPSLVDLEPVSLVQIQPSLDDRDQDLSVLHRISWAAVDRVSVWKSGELVLILERRVVSTEVRVALEWAVLTVPFSVVPESQFRAMKNVDLGLIPASWAASGAQEAVPERQAAGRTVLTGSIQETVFVDVMRPEAAIVPVLLPDRNQIH
jgi:hypothetical protein